MPVEGTNTIDGLDVTQPLGGDPVSDSDNHHRQTKAVLKYIFPGSGGNGFATPILATEAELNYLQGLTQNVNTKFGSLDTDITARIKKDGSEDFTGTVGSSAAAAADTDFVRAYDFASQTLGGTLKARYDSGTDTLYLSNDDAIDP